MKVNSNWVGLMAKVFTIVLMVVDIKVILRKENIMVSEFTQGLMEVNTLYVIFYIIFSIYRTH